MGREYTKLNNNSQNKDGGGVASFVRWQLYLCRHYLLHTVNDIKKNKVNYTLGFFACFLVVFVVSLVVTIIGIYFLHFDHHFYYII